MISQHFPGLGIPLLFVAMFGNCHVCLSMADDSEAIVAFSRMSEPEQRVHLRQLVLRFREQTRNITASTKSQACNYSYNRETRVIGRVKLMEGGVSRAQLRRIGSSYLIHPTFEPATRKPGAIASETIEAFDSEEGQNMRLSTEVALGKPKRYLGTIDSKPNDHILQSNFFYQYLGDQNAERRDVRADPWLFDFSSRFLLAGDALHVANVNTKSGTADVTCASKTPWGSATYCTLTFDLQRGGTMIKMELNEVDNGKKAKPDRFRRTYETTATDLIQIDGVWIPTKFEQIAWGSERPDQVTVHKASVSDIELNVLTKEDLRIEFPVGTEVNDLITRKRYKLDPGRDDVVN